jgi:uncharacterized protein YndB with AHSA1/START domain
MTEQATPMSVRRSVTVQASPERAFEVFTAGFSSWWPLETHHIGAADAVEAVIEPRSGSECDWGFVTAWEPPHRLLLAWHLTPEYVFDPDPAMATEVEVRFTAQDGGTLVELEHRGFEKYGEGEKIREIVSQKGGWGDLMERYAKAV